MQPPSTTKTLQHLTAWPKAHACALAVHKPTARFPKEELVRLQTANYYLLATTY